MPQRFVNPMQPVSLRVDGGESPGWYPSRVLDFEEGREIRVAAPMLRGDEVPVGPGTVLDVRSTHPEGVHVFEATVLRRAAEPDPALVISWPESAHRVQRRDSVRVETRVPVEVRTAPPGGPVRELAGTTLDLSEGGMRAAVPEPVEAGTELAARLHLSGDGPPVECAGRAVRGGETGDAAPEGRFWTAVEFTSVAPEARLELTRFVFGVQREQLRGGAA